MPRYHLPPTIVWILICLLLLSTSNAFADVRLEIPSSPNPVGSGARATGMGGAFIGVADDATAASWNPAGLFQLRMPETSIVMSYAHRREENHFSAHPEASFAQPVEFVNLNYLSFAYPFPKSERNTTISINYQQMYNFSREWRHDIYWDDPSFIGPNEFAYRQKGDLYALGLAYSTQVVKNFYLGVTLNYWGDFLLKNEWKQDYYQKHQYNYGGGITGTTSQHKSEEFSFKGWNAHLGFLWRISCNSGELTIGGVFKSPFEADIDHLEYNIITKTFNDPSYDNKKETINSWQEHLRMPMSYGIGFAYRLWDPEITLSFDIYRTHWDDFEWEDAEGIKRSPVSGRRIEDSDIDPTTWFRLGAEYIYYFNKAENVRDNRFIPIRLGFFYDPAPAENSPDDFFGFSVGSGFVTKSVVFDIAYQYRFGNDVSDAMFKDVDFSQDVQESKVYASFIFYFDN